MTTKITGKNVEPGEAFEAYVSGKLETIAEKFLNHNRGLGELGSTVRIEKVRGRFSTLCTLKLKTGLMLEAEATGDDAYASADAAIERLETRLRRYKRRLRNHHQHQPSPRRSFEMAPDRVLAPVEDEAGPEGLVGEAVPDLKEASAVPVIVAETERVLEVLPVSEAAMQLDLTEASFLVFRNAGTGGINIVYRRPDGRIGWIDPAAAR